MVVIIDYGMGNLKSVQNALNRIDCPSIISCDPQVISQSDALILPGVGAFKDCMGNLKASGLLDTLKAFAQSGKPFLGICLGMQVLFEHGYEVEPCDGLGLLKGNIKLMIEPTCKIPHIGWNLLESMKEDAFINGLNNSSFVYYVHSYMACDYEEADLLAYSSYGSLRIPGVFRKGNIIACQFHPEKSGEDGLALLRNFKEMIA